MRAAIADRPTAVTPNGASLAALLAAGIGSFAIGLFVILNEAGVYAAPSLYAPAGGVSGRTGFGVVVWLIAWGFLHFRWRDRLMDAARVTVATLVLVAAALLLTFPPVWTTF